jgi:non-lysosomal glucosylceramidase
MSERDWPILREYTGDDRQRIRFPVGGLGTGTISVDGRGRLVDVEIANTAAYGFTPQRLFFALHVAGAGTRVLEGRLFDHEYEGPHGSPSPQPGLPRFRDCVFSAAYPFARIELADPAVPLQVAIEVVNPLVPGDADASGHPAVLYRVRLVNQTRVRQNVSVAGNLPNLIGARPGTTFVHEPHQDGSVLLGSNPRRDGSAADGTIALHTPGRAASSFRTCWLDAPGGDALAEFWDDFSQDGAVRDHPRNDRDPVGSLVLSEVLEPGAEATLDFVLAWHFPYRRAWTDGMVGNHYTTLAADAGECARTFGRALPGLLHESATFVRSVIDLGMPAAMTDAALSNLSVLKSNTVFRSADGRFYGWEGTENDGGSCFGNCTHVWNYEYATIALFPELAWSMRRTEFEDSLDDRGMMAFRAGLPRHLEGTAWGYAAADGQMGSILRFYRTWRRTGDDVRARELWPAVRRALEFAWIEGGWDADRDGVMEGCQHTTMDVEYYGPSPEVQSWYLAALAAAAELATFMGELEFASYCRQLLNSGCRWMDEHLFNGEYYQQAILPPGSDARIADGLRMETAAPGGFDPQRPPYQIGSGCTSDQLAGVTMAKLSGLEIPLDPVHVATALRGIARHNHLDGIADQVNVRRSYALGDERGLVNASFPRGRELPFPFPYWAEVWTGFEYSAAVGLLLEGEHDLAYRTVADVRDRHDGRRRNPFNEVECGHHYARSMASWGLVEAWKART